MNRAISTILSSYTLKNQRRYGTFALRNGRPGRLASITKDKEFAMAPVRSNSPSGHRSLCMEVLNSL